MSLELRFDMQWKEHEMMVKLVADLSKKLVAQGEREKEKEKPSKPRRDEACHPVYLTKDDDKDKDPEAGSSGSEQQDLAIVPVSAVPMAEGDSTHQDGGDASGSGGDKGKSAAEVLYDLSNEVILLMEPDYSKEAQIDALSNLEEGEIVSDDEWDVDDEDVVVEFPKGDGEGVYELEDGEIFEAPSNTGSVEPVFVAEASGTAISTEASPTDPQPVDPEAWKNRYPQGWFTKDQAPVWQKTSIIDKHGATSMILSVKFDDDKKLFAIKRAGGVQYLKPTSEAFNSLPKYDLVNLANREMLCDTSHASAMGLWRTLQKEGRSGNFEMFKPQMPKRVRDKNVRHPVTNRSLKKLVYNPMLYETRIPLSKLSQDILGNMWYWYVDPKTGEAVVMGNIRSESGSLVPKELIRVFDEITFINFSVKDLTA
ncbi:hypothetical protein L1987_09168 [Smallanthus sonchifolius]|uniref:Uncharacterized protein n=1 Tax=Smallanthus sonchifolius TaxID=185202 RepID=A0ACB9JN65_9ASTR|nr:hypothetical protein L1987_09168 [Smallanthus sonchifolius]